MTEEKPAKKWRFDFIGGSEGISETTEELGKILFFPLSKAKVGDRLWITELKNIHDIQPLLKIGLQPGNELEVLCPTDGGSIVVSYQGNRIGLSIKIARNIMVTDNVNLIKELN